MSDLAFRRPTLLYLPGLVAAEMRGPPEGLAPIAVPLPQGCVPLLFFFLFETRLTRFIP